MEKLREGLWRLNDEAGCTAYLVIGLNRAYMIDTGMGRPPLMPQIRALTGLAVDLLLTHAHPDHFGAAGEFERIWLCADDRETLACSEPLCHRFGVPTLPVQRVRFFRDGDSFDAGGIPAGSAPTAGAYAGFLCLWRAGVERNCLRGMRSAVAISC